MLAVVTLKTTVPLLSASLLLLSATAHAEDGTADAPAPWSRPVLVPTDLDRLELDTGRTPFSPATPHVLSFQVHGEYQARATEMSSFLLTPTATVINGHPGATGDSLGQNFFVNHWLRVTPRFTVGDKLTFVGQMDVLTGLVLGDTAHDTGTDYTPRDSYNGFNNPRPRWLYLEWLTPVGLLRAGQAGEHWGSGILANDGDHPSTFGDYRNGDIMEQILFATKPLGEKSPFVVAVAGGLVYQDSVARLYRGEHAWQGIVAALYQDGLNQLGVYGVYRYQTHDQTSNDPLYPYADKLEVGVLDAAGNFAIPIAKPGPPAYFFGSAEGAIEYGTTNEERTIQMTQNGQTTDVRAYGGSVTAGIVLGAHDAEPRQRKAQMPMGSRPDLYGKLVTQIEVGYASGDGNPLDGVEHRFTFNPNHKVGLILFDEVMRFQTARAAVAAQDPLLAGPRPAPGVDLLPTQGGVSGAQYVNPTVVYRPLPNVDVKGGAVIAQATADVVDPYRLVTQGAYVNYRGGDPTRHDLGVELDVGGEWRVPLDNDLTLQLGLQAGVLFPGGALADAMGTEMKTPYLVVERVGLQF
jgi:hypothetical protein